MHRARPQPMPLLTAVALATLLLFCGRTCRAQTTSELCVIPGGICHLPSAPVGAQCFCATSMGSISGSVAARAAPLAKNLLSSVAGTAHPVTVQIYLDKTSKEWPKIDEWTRGLPPEVIVVFAYSKYMASLRNDPLTAIWYTADVPDTMVRLLALALLDQGISVRSVRPYVVDKDDGRPNLSATLQIGRSSDNRDRQPLAAEAIVTGTLPLLGAGN